METRKLVLYGAFGWRVNENGAASFHFLIIEPFYSVFGKKHRAAPFFVWLKSIIE
jgi:hypothetical protein